MRVNVDLLRGKIIERRTTYENVADKVGIDRSTFYRRLKEQGINFKIGEIHSMVEAIPLTNNEAIEIFLAE